MERARSTRIERIAMLIVAMFLLAALALSAVFILANAYHSCEHEDCLVCVCLVGARELLGGGAECAKESNSFGRCLVIVAFICLFSAFIVKNSLVNLKTRLNN